MHVVMLYNFNMEFLQAFNPLYAVPIVAVIFCALIVFTFGFKSPIQPPSFEGLEEKKSVRKRKTKEIQKQSKLVTNGKANGIASGKGKIQEVPKKKETVDNSEKPNEKPKSSEKISADKKVIKKTKPKNEKPQEKKKENVVADEANDDGWVQLVSKKGKKNRKKEDSVGPDIQFTLNQSPSRKATDTNDVNEVEKVSPSPSHVEVLNEAKKEMPEEKLLKKPNKKEAPISKKEAPASKKEAPVTKKEAPVTKKEAPVTKKEAPVTKKEAPVSKKEAPASPEKPAKLDSTVEVKPDENLEHDLKPSTNIPTASEDTGKSKKKKKKQGAASVAVEASSIIASPPVEIEPVSKIAEAPLAPPKSSEPVVDNKPVSTPEDSKTNVVFDELAGLYPEAKEKKKKKVRRDH
nr:triadin-like [Parasteatoda tepidariorum]